MDNQHARRWSIAVVLASLVLATTARAQTIDRLIIFGDSLSDAGNVFDLFGIPGPPNYMGRFSNGPVWVEVLADGLGAEVVSASRTGGHDYAFGGATTGSGSFFGLMNMGPQVSEYISTGPAPAPGDLFVILGGANDFFDGETNPQTPVTNIVARITSLAGAGAQRFLVGNLPPLGQTPDALGTPDEPAFDLLTLDFNSALDTALDDAATNLGVVIDRVDLYGMFVDVLADPAAFGFTNVTEPAYDGSTVVPDPDEYLFWDGVHPTRIAHMVLGDRALQVVAPDEVVGDVDGDGLVSFADLLAVLSTWGPCPAPCPTDLDGDGTVAFGDLLIVLANWSV